VKGVGPGNDSFVGATPVGSLPARFTANTLSATTEPGEPTRPCQQIGRTVWFSLSVPAPTTVAIDTFGSSFDTVLAVYNGGPPSTSTLVACNDDTAGAQSRVVFTAAPGATYFVQVGGAAGNAGNLVVNFNAAAPPPRNDPFAGAIAVTGIPARLTADTTSATTEPGERTQLNCGEGLRPTIGNTVWYSFTASTTTAVAVDTFGSSFDTVLAVYTGASLGNLTLVRCNDDNSGTVQSRVSFTARAGTTYFVQVGGFFNAFGNLVVNFGPGVPPPSNDDFANATAVPPLPPLPPPPATATPVTLRAVTDSATTEPNEPTAFSCDGMPVAVDNTVWYAFTPPSTMFMAADTFGSDYDTVLAVYTGNVLGSLAQVACNDDVEGPQSRVAFQANAGTTYRIQVGGFRPPDGSAAFGNLVFNLAAAPPPPACDAFATPNPACTVTVPLQGQPPARVTAQTDSATTEPGEPLLLNCAGTTAPIRNTVWYRITPTQAGTVSIDTFGSTFDTVLAVYTGSSFANLNQVTCNDDTTGQQSQVSFTATVGTTYHVQVGGLEGAFGNLVVNFRTGPPPPANDNFAAAIPVTTLPTSFPPIDTTSATTEPGEPTAPPRCFGTPIGKTVWYRFTPAVNTPITIDTAGSNFDTIVSVYTGTGLSGLTNVACNDDPPPGGFPTGVQQARVSFLAGANTTYYIQIGGFNSAFGMLQVSFAVPPPPPNDNFVNATPVTASQLTAVTLTATIEPGEPTALDPSCGPNPGTIGNTVWYRFTPTTNGTVTIDTAGRPFPLPGSTGSDFDTVLAVYTGPGLGSLTRVACDDDSAGQQSQVSVPVTGGVTYHVQVGGFNGAAGNLVVNFGPVPGPGQPALSSPSTTPQVRSAKATATPQSPAPGRGADPTSEKGLPQPPRRR
jgi:hypothetical protein